MIVQRWWYTGLALAALLLSVAACGDDGGSGGDTGDSTGAAGTEAPALPDAPPPDFSTVDTITEDRAGAALGDLCSVWLACECPGTDAADVDWCDSHFATLATGAIDEAGAEVTYDGDCVARVVSAFEYLGCVTESQVYAHFEVMTAAAELDACKMYYGDQPEGAVCTELSNSNGDDCLPELECVNGTCEPQPEQLPAGEVCTSQEQCEPGLVCLIEAVGSETQICQVLPEVGQACLFGLVCTPGAFCDAEGNCAELPAAGGDCADVADVFDRVCRPEAHCVDGSCESLPVGGQACADGACAPGFVCQSDVCEAEAAAICAGGSFPLFPET